MLRLRVLVAAFALCASAAPSKTAPKGRKARTLQELVSFAIKSGDDETLPEKLVGGVGFAGTVRSRDISYAPQVAPDRASHSFFLIFEGSSPKPVALLWTRLLIENPGDGQVSHWQIFRTSVSGELEAASVFDGDLRDVVAKPSPLTDSVRSLFKRERTFFLVDAVPLQINR